MKLLGEKDPFIRALNLIGFDEVYERPCSNELVIIDRSEKKIAHLDLIEWKLFVSDITNVEFVAVWGHGICARLKDDDVKKISEYILPFVKIEDQMETNI